MKKLRDDNSLVNRVVHVREQLFNRCDMYTQVAGDSMSPAYQPGTYLFCDLTATGVLEPGKAYVFCVKTHPHYTYVFKRFDGMTEGVIQISTVNPAYSPCEPIAVADLIDVWVPKWLFIKTADDEPLT